MSTPNKKPAPKAKWAFLCDGTRFDERIPPDSPERGKWTVPSLYGIDSRGALWRDIDTAEPVFLGFPPPIP